MTEHDDDVVSLRHLSKTFPGVTALNDVSLTIRPGEIHALVGQNGSGKSTLIKVLAGVHQPDAGAEATVRGRPLVLGNARSAHELGIRFVHQDLGLVDTLSSVDNLALGFGFATGRAGRIRWREQEARARRALGHVVDEGFPLHRLAGSLTVFQRTALAIARAFQDMRENGSLLVLDEPTATMPRAEVEHLFGLLRRIRALGIPVLLVTHHLEEVFAVSDRVTVLRDGQWVGTSAAADMDTGGVVRMMTGGRNPRVERAEHATVGDVAMSMRAVAGTTLRGIDLDLHRGEIVGVAGLDGSGREELCGLLFGSRPRTGDVVLVGRPLPPARPDESVRRKVGFVPADRHRQGLVMTQSARHNLTLPTLRAFAPRGRIRRRAETAAVQEAIDAFGIKIRSADSGVSSLSGGNQQKVVLAKWLRARPDVLLLDEPTQGVDVAAQADIHQLLVRAAATGAAVLLCSSDEMELSRVCDRVLVLADGRVATELDRSEATAHQIVAATVQGGNSAAAPVRDRVS